MRYFHRAILLLLGVLEQIVVSHYVHGAVVLFPMPSFPSACYDRDTDCGGGGDDNSSSGAVSKDAAGWMRKGGGAGGILRDNTPNFRY